VNYVSEQRDDSSEYEFLAGITEEPVINAVKQTSGFAKEVYTEMKINDKKIKFQIDCGASINVITECYATGSNIIPSNKTLKMWNGSELKPLGTTRLIVRNPKTEKKYSIEFIVVPDTLTPLIGARTAQQMGLITVHEDKFVSVASPERERKPKNQDNRNNRTANNPPCRCVFKRTRNASRHGPSTG
jgi:hypothetical protein